MRRRALAQEIQALQRELQRPSFLHVRAPLLIHERRPPGSKGKCPCCGSETAWIAEERAGEDLIIDVSTGDRFLRSETSDPIWTPKEEIARVLQVPLRMSRDQEEMILDDSRRHRFASGGNRSAKTSAGLVWITRQWILRGGPGLQFWLCASVAKKAFELLQKMIQGDSQRPPFLPGELVVRSPVTHRAGDMRTIMIDGSIFDLKSYDGDPKGERLKSNPIIAAIVDEAAAMSTTNQLTALRGRCPDYGGRLFLASTPTPSSFLKEEVVLPAMGFASLPEDDPVKVGAGHRGAPWIFKELAILENPWLDRGELEADLRTLNLEDPAVQRDWFGRWITGAGELWRDWSSDRHVLVHEARDFSGVGLTARGALGVSNHIPITDQCVRLVFGQQSPHYAAVRATNTRYVLGCDVNCHPMTSVALQITAPKGAESDRDQWHFWAFEQIRTTHGNSYAHASQVVSTYFGRMLEPTRKDSPFEGCGVVIDAKSLGYDPTAHKFGGDPQGIALVFGRLGLDVRAPLYVPTDKGPRPKPPNRKDSFILVQKLLREGRLHIHTRCNAVIEAFLRQEDSGDGETPVKNDPLDSAMDALRYALYGIVHAPAPVRYGRL